MAPANSTEPHDLTVAAPLGRIMVAHPPNSFFSVTGHDPSIRMERGVRFIRLSPNVVSHIAVLAAKESGASRLSGM